jgi:hydrogenase nickel incorporation protein HypB
MCKTCGCSDDAQPTLTDLQSGATLLVTTDRKQVDDHPPRPGHADDLRLPRIEQQGGPTAVLTVDDSHKTIRLEQDLLAKSRLLAERNRSWLAGRSILALNLISSPGAGKTTLLERTIRDLTGELSISVIEGDQATLHDAQRIQATGCRVVQINTGAGCHLEAAMTARGLQQLNPPLRSVVMIENVGNLVCPALFDLGERAKVVIMSVTEGEEKPLKYPHAFRASEVMILNKIDLLPYVQFDVDRCLTLAREANPRLKIFQLSATRSDGLDAWYDWLRDERARSPFHGSLVAATGR